MEANVPEATDLDRLFVATAAGDSDTIKVLLKRKPSLVNISHSEYGKRTALHVAIATARIEIALSMIEEFDADASLLDGCGGSVYTIACTAVPENEDFQDLMYAAWHKKSALASTS